MLCENIFFELYERETEREREREKSAIKGHNITLYTW